MPVKWTVTVLLTAALALVAACKDDKPTLHAQTVQQTGQQQADQNQLPPGHPPLAVAGEASLPAGHPPIAPATQPALPPGHPPLATQPALPPGHPPLGQGQGMSMQGMNVPGVNLPAATGQLTYTLPKGWTEQRGTGPRYATITSPDDRKAELAITNFPGNVGGNLANINRWRQQVGLEPIDQEQFEKTTTKIEIGQTVAIVADLDGPQARMLAAIIPDNQKTWFFKMAGSKDVMEKNKAEFLDLIKSVRVKE